MKGYEGERIIENDILVDYDDLNVKDSLKRKVHDIDHHPYSEAWVNHERKEKQ